ncbi:HAD family hydrolase [Shimazuella sp. AN120528]|uniref:HAD family hydrolase n=1 Tax=Shimazuella soli TaxID=1892854 RepID=UPI001F0EB3C2|nr:HAD family hydrolase [Shimazuella soli]MCH5584161.1 HAD family hydrolase [Shimazuella soli]
MIRLFVSDLDGTLLTDEKTVSRTDQVALQKLKDAGIEICLATGRNRTEIEQVMQHLKLPYYQVTQNGAEVYGENGQLLHSSQFQPQTALVLFQLIQSFGIFVPIIIDAFLGNNLSDLKRVIPFEQKSHFSYEDDDVFKHVSGLDNKIGVEIMPIKFSCFGDVRLLRLLEAEVHKQLPNQLNSFLVDKDCLDFMPLYVHKGAGLQLILDHLGLSKDEVVCIGDSENDISMFDLISNSFAMETASSHVQSKASKTASSVADAVEWTISYSGKNMIQL